MQAGERLTRLKAEPISETALRPISGDPRDPAERPLVLAYDRESDELVRGEHYIEAIRDLVRRIHPWGATLLATRSLRHGEPHARIRREDVAQIVGPPAGWLA